MTTEFESEIAKQEAEAKAAGRDESAMRDSEAPHPQTIEDLAAYIKALGEGPHTYGTCVYAMSLSAVAAFNYIAHVLGVTGFQASCADLDILKRTRGIVGPFGIMQADDLLYPQYDLPGKLATWIAEWRPWLRDRAREKLAEPGNGHAHPAVVAHWRKLAED